MREAFHENLRTISDQLVEMTRLASSAMSRATTALLDADVHLAESVIAADKQIDAVREGWTTSPSTSWRASSPWPPTCGWSSPACG